MTGFVLGPNQTKWIEALESGRYEQGIMVLHKDTGTMCCLGVAAHILAEENEIVPKLIKTGQYTGCYMYQDDVTIAPEYVIKALSLRNHLGSGSKGNTALVVLNDDLKYSFAQIAEHLRKNAEFYFERSS